MAALYHTSVGAAIVPSLCWGTRLRARRSSHSKTRLAGAALALLVYTPASHAACDAPYSGCFSADNVFPEAYAGSGVQAPRLRTSLTRVQLGASFAYLSRPLLLRTASPDPEGNEISVLEDWSVLRLSGASKLGPVEWGLVWPLSLGGSGGGLAATTTRTGHSSVTGFGAPHLQLRWTRQHGDFAYAIGQEWVLPVGAERAFLGSRGVTFAPKLTGQWQSEAAFFVLAVGARLRQPTSFGPVRFGSEAVFVASGGLRLLHGLEAFVEAFSTPSLVRDEARLQVGAQRIWRVPAEWLFGVSLERTFGRALLAAGSSIPVSSQSSPHGEETFAGPPSPRVRIESRFETGW